MIPKGCSVWEQSRPEKLVGLVQFSAKYLITIGLLKITEMTRMDISVNRMNFSRNRI